VEKQARRAEVTQLEGEVRLLRNLVADREVEGK
jgi:hypothetical protein